MSSARRLVIVVWSCGPDRPGGAVLAAAPFVYALAARALDLDVEMHFTSTAVRWLVAGEADAAHTDRARSKTVRDFIREAQDAGVKLYACAMARHAHARDETLIDGIEGIAGAATVIDASAAADVRVMVF
jgi:predicted peroxiredoxin